MNISFYRDGRSVYTRATSSSAVPSLDMTFLDGLARITARGSAMSSARLLGGTTSSCSCPDWCDSLSNNLPKGCNPRAGISQMMKKFCSIELAYLLPVRKSYLHWGIKFIEQGWTSHRTIGIWAVRGSHKVGLMTFRLIMSPLSRSDIRI
jgi:hypothetical protein